eukprot:NODE_2674_length_2168_cov_6.731014.p1 GENE.NODE_2674_length_2168_cov_6.731014~~NODE_2674_length_2168_cov_6.731014.p1  ORF type:complete len:610 (+),score=109.07 NODE_2674_length_2168_cov_6.731014:122-1831(+)
MSAAGGHLACLFASNLTGADEDQVFKPRVLRCGSRYVVCRRNGVKVDGEEAICIYSRFISKRHAVLWLEVCRNATAPMLVLCVEDWGSTNGVVVDGMRMAKNSIVKKPLGEGAHVEICFSEHGTLGKLGFHASLHNQEQTSVQATAQVNAERSAAAGTPGTIALAGIGAAVDAREASVKRSPCGVTPNPRSSERERTQGLVEAIAAAIAEATAAAAATAAATASAATDSRDAGVTSSVPQAQMLLYADADLPMRRRRRMLAPGADRPCASLLPRRCGGPAAALSGMSAAGGCLTCHFMLGPTGGDEDLVFKPRVLRCGIRYVVSRRNEVQVDDEEPICIYSKFISKRHAVLWLEACRFASAPMLVLCVKDCGSTNGVVVDGIRMAKNSTVTKPLGWGISVLICFSTGGPLCNRTFYAWQRKEQTRTQATAQANAEPSADAVPAGAVALAAVGAAVDASRKRSAKRSPAGVTPGAVAPAAIGGAVGARGAVFGADANAEAFTLEPVPKRTLCKRRRDESDQASAVPQASLASVPPARDVPTSAVAASAVLAPQAVPLASKRQRRTGGHSD